MTKYLRLGGIPTNERSINWYKVSLDDQAGFSWALDVYGYEAALREISNLEEVLEDGVSVFELDEEGNPVLENEELRKTYEDYIGRGYEKTYVTGDIAGRGDSGEPLLRNIKVIA